MGPILWQHTPIRIELGWYMPTFSSVVDSSFLITITFALLLKSTLRAERRNELINEFDVTVTHIVSVLRHRHQWSPFILHRILTHCHVDKCFYNKCSAAVNACLHSRLPAACQHQQRISQSCAREQCFSVALHGRGCRWVFHRLFYLYTRAGRPSRPRTSRQSTPLHTASQSRQRNTCDCTPRPNRKATRVVIITQL